MTRITLAVSALSGAAIVAYGMQVLARPMSKDTADQCIKLRRGPYYDAYSGHFVVLGHAVDAVLCMLFGFFNNIARTLVGKAIGTAFASAFFPILAVMIIFGAERGKTSAVVLPIGVALIGQLITIGIASNVIWLPYFASVATKSASSSAPSPASVAPVLGASMLLALLASLPTFAISAAHPKWVYGNFAFQFFPLLLTPVVVAAAAAPRVTASASRAPYATLLRVVGAISVAVWWLAIAQAVLHYDGLPSPADEGSKRFAKTLLSPLFTGATVPAWPLRIRAKLADEFNEGARFLVCDMIGLLIAAYTAVGVHASKPARSLVLPTLLGGPGYALSTYFANHYAIAAGTKQKTK